MKELLTVERLERLYLEVTICASMFYPKRVDVLSDVLLKNKVKFELILQQ